MLDQWSGDCHLHPMFYVENPDFDKAPWGFSLRILLIAWLWNLIPFSSVVSDLLVHIALFFFFSKICYTVTCQDGIWKLFFYSIVCRKVKAPFENWEYCVILLNWEYPVCNSKLHHGFCDTFPSSRVRTVDPMIPMLCVALCTNVTGERVYHTMYICVIVYVVYMCACITIRSLHTLKWQGWVNFTEPPSEMRTVNNPVRKSLMASSFN